MSRPAKSQSHHAAGSRTHGAGVLREEAHDAYRPTEKASSGTTCPDCHAQVQEGRWVWPSAVGTSSPAAVAASPERPPSKAPSRRSGHARSQRCPACARLQAQDPAGILTLSGGYVREHEAGLRALLIHESQREAALHPLERLMSLEVTREGGLRATTTGLHLPRMLAHALERAHRGSLKTVYADDQCLVRVDWHRDG